MHMKRTFALITLLALSLGALTACNTMQGIGEDIQKVGGKISDAAKQKQQEQQAPQEQQAQ
jgi:predicted small secreted protein